MKLLAVHFKKGDWSGLTSSNRHLSLASTRPGE